MGRRRKTELENARKRIVLPAVIIGGVLFFLLLAFLLPSRNQLFNSSRAYAHMKALVDFGPRPSGSEALIKSREYIKSHLSACNLEVKESSFTADTPLGNVPMTNLWGVHEGKREDIIILAAHYETKLFSDFTFAGANDNASGTAVLLEMARLMTLKKYSCTMWLVFLDGEEALEQWSSKDGLYGSREFVKSVVKTGKPPKAMILVDMVGDRTLNINREANSSPWLTDLMTRSAKSLGLSRYFSGRRVALNDDHIPFLEEGIPSLDMIDFDYQYWHTAGDNLEHVSEESLGITGKVLEAMLDSLDRMDRMGEKGSNGVPSR